MSEPTIKMLVTAGPTREPLDPVRFISNRSTGKMGYAIAEAGVRAGYAVELVSGPVHLVPPPGVAVTGVATAEDMLQAVRARVEWCDVLVMTAAVADWRPALVSSVKLKKSSMPELLALERTPDILTAIRPLKGGRLFVGFAAETGELIREAGRKLRDKGLDLIVANDVTMPGSGFEGDTNQVTVLDRHGLADEWPLLDKKDVAARLVDLITRRWQSRP